MPALAVRERHPNEGRGQRLTEALASLEHFPVLAESRERLLAALARGSDARGDIVRAIESDAALILAVMGIANRSRDRGRRLDSVPAAVALLPRRTIRSAVAGIPSFDLFADGAWNGGPERFRLHATATRQAADRIAVAVGYEDRDRLAVTSMLHDIGGPVLEGAYPGYLSEAHGGARTPEERIHRERRELGVDHALLGGVLARRAWLPKAIAESIERHHDADVEGEAAIVRLADMFAHYQSGSPVFPGEVLRVAAILGLAPARLRQLLYELSIPPSQRPRCVDPCPLSRRELGILERLAEGKVYKQIASDVTLSVSTVRSHLHNIYGKLGAVDRAQAVLIAVQRGWIEPRGA